MAVLLGRTTAGTNGDFNGASHCAVWKFTASASGQLVTLFGQTKVANAGITSVDLAVYADDAANSRPGAKLGEVNVTAGVTGASAFSGTIAAVTIVSGTVYWLGWRGIGEQFDWQGDTSGSYLEATGTGVFPDPWPAGASAGSLNAILWGEDGPASFTNTVAPTVTGALDVGGTLTANPGTWTPTPGSFTYYWRRADDAAGANLVEIGATGATYTLAAADASKYIQAGVIPHQ